MVPLWPGFCSLYQPFTYLAILDTLMLRFFCRFSGVPGYLVLHSFVHIVSTFWNDFLAPSHLWGTCLVSLPPLPGDHYVLYASTRSGATELLLLYLFIRFSSSVELISSSRVWGSFSCVLWYLIQHQYILGQSSVKSFCKGSDSKYFRYLGILAGHVVSIRTTQLCC